MQREAGYLAKTMIIKQAVLGGLGRTTLRPGVASISLQAEGASEFGLASPGFGRAGKDVRTFIPLALSGA